MPLRGQPPRLFPEAVILGEGIITPATKPAASTEAFNSAHAALRADPSVQFGLPPAKPPPESPAWLKAFFDWLGDVLEPVGRFLKWIGSFMPDAPYARIFLWSVLAVAAALIAWTVYQRVRTGEWRLPRFKRAQALPAEAAAEWLPDAAPARAWLDEADALAREGRFADAIHHLLFRTIEDIASRRPKAVRPSLTSREIASSDAIPPTARGLFRGIAQLVERSLFGGRAVSADDWTEARAAYANFALPQAWRA